VYAASSAYVRSRTDAGARGSYPVAVTLETLQHERFATMLYTIAVVLLILWVLGLVSSYTMGGLIHVLLVVALVVILINFIGGRRSL